MRLRGPGRLAGEGVALRDPRAADLDPFAQAFADDPELGALLGFDADLTRADIKRLIRREERDRADGEALRLAIADPASDAFLGLILLHTFVWRHRRADCGFFVIPAARGRGAALEALRLLLGWAFGTLGLARVGMLTLPENAATQRLAARAGFQREGVLRDYALWRGRRTDNVVLGAVASTWA